MTKRLHALTAFLFLVGFSAHSQTISPDNNTPICPGQSTTFTVTVPVGTTYYVSNISGISLTNTNSSGVVLITRPATVSSQATNVSYPDANTTRFTFTGSFDDNATPQSFRVTVTNTQTAANTPYDFTYYKIESFNPANNNYSLPRPNVTSISTPLCQTSPINIFFNNVQYASNNPQGIATYSTVTQYQYLLPSGWSLNGTTSNGNWIAGTNNVNIIPDGNSGNGGTVQVRAVSSCSASLIQGPAGQISVTRPSPSGSESIVPGDGTDYICSGSKTYSVGNLPAGSSVSWSLASYPNVASIPANSTGGSVTVTGGTVSGVATLNASVTNCDGPHTFSYNIRVGKPGSAIVGSLTNLDYCPQWEPDRYVSIKASPGASYPYSGTLVATDNAGVASNYAWSQNPNDGGNNGIFWTDNGRGSITVSAKTTGVVAARMLNMSNTCGSSAGYWVFAPRDCNDIARATIKSVTASASRILSDSIALAELTVYPNPAHDQVNITLPDNTDPSKTIVVITDSYGRRLRQARAVPGINSLSLSGIAAGLYFISVEVDHHKVSTKKILKN